MASARPHRLWLDVCWFLLWAGASSLWCLHAAGQVSATFDEPFYLKAGLDAWRTHSHVLLIRAGTMPLPVDAETFPVYMWENLRGQTFDTEADLEKILPLARAMNLGFWWVLLLYGWRLANHYGGRWAGRLAVPLLACEPNLLAHAALATTDIALTATMLVLVYHFAVGRDGGWGRRVGIPAVCFGVALLAKASALTFGPLCLLAVEWHHLAEQGRLWPANSVGVWQRLGHLWSVSRPLRRDALQIIALGFVILFVGCGCDWRPQPSFVQWAHGLPDGVGRALLVWTSEHLCLFSNAGEAVVRQIKHNMQGHGAFLLGEWQPRAIWYYFPVVLTIKLTIPTLGLLALLALGKPRLLATALGGCVLLLFLFSFNCRVQIGIRLIFPLVALLLTTLAVGLARWQPSWPTRAKYGVLAGVVAAVLLPLLVRWPNGISYTNVLWTGTDLDQVVSEANYDWGQGLPELADWQRSHGAAPLDVWYYGTDPAVNRPPFHHLPLHQRPLQSPDDLEPLVKGDYLAVSTSIFAFHRQLTPASSVAVAALQRRRPVARTTTFLIYDFTTPEGHAAARQVE